MTDNKGTILVADDKDSPREVVEDFLEALFPGYNLESFKDGTSVQRKLESELINPSDVKLLITDNEMPGIEGSEIARQYAKKVGFPIILVYGGLKNIGQEAVQDGAYGYLIKPAKLSKFRTLVSSALGEK